MIKGIKFTAIPTADPPAPSAVRIDGRSEAFAPIAATSKRTGSSAAVRHSANSPLSVMYAEIARKTSTIMYLLLAIRPTVSVVPIRTYAP